MAVVAVAPSAVDKVLSGLDVPKHGGSSLRWRDKWEQTKQPVTIHIARHGEEGFQVPHRCRVAH
jgi:hypothetical protein